MLPVQRTRSSFEVPDPGRNAAKGKRGIQELFPLAHVLFDLCANRNFGLQGIRTFFNPLFETAFIFAQGSFARIAAFDLAPNDFWILNRTNGSDRVKL